MLEVNELLNQKENLMQSITKQLLAWEQNADQAVRILEKNNQKFNQMKEIDTKIPTEQLIAFNEKYKEHWLRIINRQQKLMKLVEEEKIHTQAQLTQISQKEKIISNYITVKNKSIFVEKNY